MRKKPKAKSKFNYKKLILPVILIYLLYTFAHQEIVINKKKATLNNYKTELERIEDENKSLFDQILMSNTYRYVEQLARERLGFIKEGETVVISKELENE